MEKNSEFLAKIGAHLKSWDTQVDALAAEGEKADGESRKAYYEQVKDLRAGRDEVRKTFEKIRFATESAGSQMHAGMQLAWETMQKALVKASSDLRK